MRSAIVVASSAKLWSVVRLNTCGAVTGDFCQWLTRRSHSRTVSHLSAYIKRFYTVLHVVLYRTYSMKGQGP